MSRRVLGIAALAAGLLTTGLVPFLGSASAAACPTWTDPAGDATPSQYPVAQLADDNMDVVAATLSTSGSNVVATIKLTNLVAGFSDIGDRYTLQFNLPTANLRFYADRDLTGDYAGIVNITGSASGEATAVWDVDKDTVTITSPQAEVDKAAGGASKGKEAVVVAAGSGAQAMGEDVYAYDTASAPAGMKYVIGGACTGGGTPQPTGSATPTATPSATPTATPTASPTASPSPGTLPEGYPRAGCDTFTDAKGDGGVDAPVSNSGQPVAQGQNDPDLDLTGLVLGTTPTDLVAFLRVDDLKALPSQGGHEFNVTFTHNAKVIQIYAAQYEAVYSAYRNATSAALTFPTATGGRVAGTYNADLKVTSVFDVTNNVVKLTLTRASLDTVAGKPAPNGTTVTAVSGASRMITPTGGYNVADTVLAATADKQVFTFGDSPCFSAPPGVLTNTGKTTVQYGDSAALAAKLTNAAGTPLAGKRVTFAIGSKSVSATTGSDGVAKASLNPGLVAGTYNLVTSFAGDAAAGEVSLTKPFTVTAEKTRFVLSVAKSGTSRTVTAKLLDDDGRPVAGQTVVWYVNGKKVATSKTTSAGVAVLKTAKPTQTVKVVYAGLSAKYLGTTASQKV